MTPLMLQMFLAHVTYDPRQFFPETWNNEPQREARDWLIGRELVNEDGGLTERGDVWLKEMLQTPLPQPAWTVNGRLVDAEA